MAILAFSKALPSVITGGLFRRRVWPKGDFIYFVGGSTFQVNRKPLLGIFTDGTNVSYAPHIDYLHSDVNTASVWVPTQEDILGYDWEQTFVDKQQGVLDLLQEKDAPSDVEMPRWAMTQVWTPDYASLISEEARSRALQEAVKGMRWLQENCFGKTNATLTAFLYAFYHKNISQDAKSAVLRDAAFIPSILNEEQLKKQILFKRDKDNNTKLMVPTNCLHDGTNDRQELFISGALSLMYGLDPIDQKFLRAVFIRTQALTYSRITGDLEKILNIRIQADKYPVPAKPEEVRLEEQDALAEVSPFKVKVEDFVAPAAGADKPVAIEQWYAAIKKEQSLQ